MRIKLPLICIPLRRRDPNQTVALMPDKTGQADLVEIPLGKMKMNACYLDIPFKNFRRQKRLPRAKAKLILSHHDFKRTPSPNRLLSLAIAMHRAGADIVKIAVQAKRLEDTLNVILLAQQLQQKKIPHILIAMGPLGRLSRILTPHLGGTLMYAHQITVRELKKAWSLIK